MPAGPAPPVRYPAELPITARKDEITAALASYQVLIVAGETGSGKSTQLPKMCLDLGRGVEGMIGHTQPRRLAARTVAERIAQELGTRVGGTVGYAVRFTDRVGKHTRIKLMTDGILLAEIPRDRDLRRYDTLIIDEAHERSLNIDFLLGYVQRLLPRRPDLKVVVTSATIDTERFSAHFGDAPVIEVSGRTYPVEVRYRPLDDPEHQGEPGVRDGPDREDRDQVQAICEAVEELAAEGPGDILVFCSGEREIRDAADALGALAPPGTELLPLYARLSAADQHRVFQPHPGRRVVLATNIAETSLTVPGVRYVIDAGTARISRYNRRTKVQRLPIEPVSQASANQRAGRCGRVAPGICIRLFSEADFDSRPEFTEPEILRTNLASVILQMAALGLGDVAGFPFVDPPDARAVKDGIDLLEELGALRPGGGNPAGRLTRLGRRLARLPVDPRLGRMVLEAGAGDCLHEVLLITAALAIQDPRERPAERRAAADEAHARFGDAGSDFLAYLHLWDYLGRQQEALSSNQFRKLCRAEFLNYLRVREWQDVYGQLRQVARDLGLRISRQAADPEAIHRALLAGLLSHIGLREGTARDYRGARGARFALAPGSTLFKRSPRWVMAAELVETNRLWARVAAPIQPEWAEDLGGHLVKRSHGEPRWDAARGEAMTSERVTLYGLPIVTARPVGYARVDPAGARDLFLQHALVEGEWDTHHAFVERNRELVEQVRATEARARRRDLLVDEAARFAFYDGRVPAEVTSARRFDRWWKEAATADPVRLDFTLDVLMNPEAERPGSHDYPERWRMGNADLSLSYEFEPGSETDGVTVHVPLPLLHRVAGAGFDWQVPGRRQEMVTALIRSLPKSTRRSFVPAGDHARSFLARASPGDGPLVEVLAADLSRASGETVGAGDFDPERIPDHLKVNVSVEDGSGRRLDSGRDLDALTRRMAGRIRAAVAEAARGYEREGLTRWSVGRLARAVEVDWAGHTVAAYPALVDEGDSVALRVFTSRAAQEGAMWAGTRRLLLLTLPAATRGLSRRLPNDTKLALARSPYGSTAELLDDCTLAAVDQLLADHGGPAWDEEGFEALGAAVDARLAATVEYVATVVGGILAAAGAIELRLDRVAAAPLRPAVTDIRRQLSGLVFAGFVGAVGLGRLADVLRYLGGVERRLDRLTEGTRRDTELMQRVQRLEAAYRDLREAVGPAPDVEAVRWMLEELRVSFFAQALGTAQPVSETRIRREIARIASV